MSHPFFDAPTYPWGLQEAIDFHKAISSAVAVSARILGFYQMSGGDPAIGVNLGQAPGDIWREVLDKLTTQGCLKTLLDRIDKEGDFRNNSAYQEVARRVREAEDTTRPQIVSDDVFIVDREGLRRSLTLLEVPKGLTKVLLVRGSPKSGKSHGRHLFEHVAERRDAVAVYIYAENGGTVDEVIDQLFSALGALDRVPPRTTTPDAWYKKVWGHLQNVATDKKRQLWIAMDDLGLDAAGAPLLDPEVKRFFDHAVPWMLNPAFRNQFRLMLINYPGDPRGAVPTSWTADYWTEDNPTVGDLAKNHVVAFLEYWTKTRQLQESRENLENLADEVLQKAPAEAPGLEGIYIALKKAVAGLGASTP